MIASEASVAQTGLGGACAAAIGSVARIGREAKSKAADGTGATVFALITTKSWVADAGVHLASTAAVHRVATGIRRAVSQARRGAGAGFAVSASEASVAHTILGVAGLVARTTAVGRVTAQT